MVKTSNSKLSNSPYLDQKFGQGTVKRRPDWANWLRVATYLFWRVFKQNRAGPTGYDRVGCDPDPQSRPAQCWTDPLENVSFNQSNCQCRKRQWRIQYGSTLDHYPRRRWWPPHLGHHYRHLVENGIFPTGRRKIPTGNASSTSKSKLYFQFTSGTRDSGIFPSEGHVNFWRSIFGGPFHFRA